MPYIYKIINTENSRVYIGQTSRSLDIRWKEHLQDSKNNSRNHLPLYRAINKYGENNFTITLIEETDEVDEREIYWIKKYNSYNDGYNATLGGGGTNYLNLNIIEVINYFHEHNNQINLTAEFFNCSRGSIRNLLKGNNIFERCLPGDGINLKPSKKIIQKDKQNNIIQIFNTLGDAYRYLNKPFTGHLQDVCNGKRKSAYNYIWEWFE